MQSKHTFNIRTPHFLQTWDDFFDIESKDLDDSIFDLRSRYQIKIDISESFKILSSVDCVLSITKNNDTR